MKTNKFKKMTNYFSRVWYKLMTLSFAKYILFFYLFITIIGSLLLYIPISSKADGSVAYIDALFTSASAFSDTGLTTLSTSATWTEFGQAIVAILILVGGIGWFSLKIYLFNIILGRPVSFKNKKIVSSERGVSKMGDTNKIIKVSITILFLLLFIFSLTLTLYFYFSEPVSQPFQAVKSQKMLYENPQQNLGVSVRWGLFHTISALNNAGFDIMGSHSLQPFYNDHTIQIIFIVLFVIGGIGYPVIYDFYLWIVSRFKREKFHWSLFTKISMVTYVLISLLGIGAIFGIELNQVKTIENTPFWQNDKYGSDGNKAMALVFNTFSTRNAGFATIDMKSLSSSSLIIYSLMMFIGSAPSSTAGGIRTITIAIVLLSLWSRIRGRNDVRAFNRTVPKNTVNKSFAVFTTALILVLASSVVIMSISNVPYTFRDVLFETTSAFGTTGLSTGITPTFSIATKILLILLMFIGQLGVSSTLLVWDKKNNKSRKFNFIEEDVATG